VNDRGPAVLDRDELPTLTGEQIVLRWLQPRDIPALLSVFGDPEVIRYWGTPLLHKEEEAAALLAECHQHFDTRYSLQWGIARRSDDELLGTCSLYRPQFAHRRSEIGFALGRAHWGKGYAGEAIALAIEFAFGPLDFHRLEADVEPRNTASLRTLERAGFRREGLLRERYHLHGETQDSVYLGLLRSEWRSRVQRAH
jgi:ribosomal-protein-alanine N-acetyltransferase